MTKQRAMKPVLQVVPEQPRRPRLPLEAGSVEAGVAYPRRERGGGAFYERVIDVRRAIDRLETQTHGSVMVRRWHFRHRARIKAGLEYQIERLQYWLSLIEQHEQAIAARTRKEMQDERDQPAPE